MSTYHFKKQRTPVTKRVKTDDGLGTKSAPNGFLVGDIEVEIDWERIVEFMGGTALKANSRTCRDGYVIVKARNVKHEGAMP